MSINDSGLSTRALQYELMVITHAIRNPDTKRELIAGMEGRASAIEAVLVERGDEE